MNFNRDGVISDSMPQVARVALMKREVTRRIRTVGRAAICVAVALVLWFFYGVYQFPGRIQEVVVYPLVTNVLATFMALFLGYPIAQDEFDKRHRRSTIGLPLSFWDTGAKSRPFYVVFGGSSGNGNTVDANGQHEQNDKFDPKFGFHTIDSWTLIRNFLSRTFPYLDDTEIIPMPVPLGGGENEEMAVNRIIDGANVIVLGGCLSLPISSAVTECMEAPYRQHARDGEARVIVCNDGTRHTSKVIGNRVETDFALVTKVVRTNGNLLVIVAGNYGVGTTGGLLCLTNKELFPADCADHGKVSQQWVIRSTIVSNAADPVVQNIMRPDRVTKIHREFFTPPPTWASGLISYTKNLRLTNLQTVTGYREAG
jgi:hypothetical protein